MDPVSETHIGKILNPAPIAGEVGQEAESAPVSLEEIVAPGGEQASGYTGPERRAQGYLIAEVLPDSPALDRQSPEFDPPR
jgi:hypothetical protein